MANYMLFKYIIQLYKIDTSAAFCTSPIGQIKTTAIPIFRIKKSLTVVDLDSCRIDPWTVCGVRGALMES